MHNTYNSLTSSRRFFLCYSFALIALLLPQPFSDITRFVLYSSILFIGAIILFRSMKERKPCIVDKALIFFLSYEFWTLILLLIHNEFMTYGLALFIQAILFYVCFLPISSDELEKEIHDICLVLTCITIFAGIISFLIVPTLQRFPSLNELQINGRDFVFYGMANTNDTRLWGYGRQPNQTGMLLSIGAMSSIYLYFYTKKKLDILLACVNITICTAFFALASPRSSILATGIFFILFVSLLFLFSIKNHSSFHLRRIYIVLLLILLIAVVFIFLIIFSATFRDWLLNDLLRINSIRGATGRNNLQKIVLDEYCESGKYLLGISKERTISVTPDRLGPHNTFIEILTGKGLISLFLFLCGIICTLIYSVKLYSKHILLSQQEILMLSFSVSSVFATIIQNSFECAFLYNMWPVTPFEIWSFCIPSIIYFNLRKRLTR